MAMLSMAVAVAVVGAQSPGRANAPAAVNALRLYVFDGGILQSDPARYRLTKEEVGTTELSIGAYLIVHPRGVLLWDTGAVPDADWKPTGRPVEQRLQLLDKQERRVTLQSTIAAQLASTGHSAATVTYLALSHYHWDHTANANVFAGAQWLARPADRDAMFGPSPAGTSRPETYAALRKSRTTLITTPDHDVFGDGTVVLKLAAGHTPGHQVLYLKLAKTGDVVLAGDLYHYRQERTLNRLPTFDFDENQTRLARQGLEAFLTKTKASLWIQHELAAHQKLKKAPAFYD
jgi:glyoxylase-like metal-dependent hydrolase (beta-lactamase superfamily II)